MRYFLAILMVNALVVMPLNVMWLSDGCSCVSADSISTSNEVVQSTSSCCLEVDEQPEDDSAPSPLPCDEGHCPTACCTTVVHAAFVSRSLAELIESNRIEAVSEPCVEFDLLQPHLLRLKRPPRIV